MTSRTQLGCIVMVLVAGCGSPPPPPAPAVSPSVAPAVVSPEPASDARTAAIAPVLATAAAEVASAESAETDGQPSTPPPASGADPVAWAIEPVLGAVEIVALASHHATRWVLYRFRGDLVARARMTAEPSGAADLEVLDDALDECVDGDSYQAFTCAVAVAPDPSILAASFCETAHAWGVARIEARDGAPVATVERILFAASCDDGAALEIPASLRARDVDGDGRVELVVALPIAIIRDDAGMGGTTEGVIAHVLDGDTLRSQLRLTSHYESGDVDVGGTRTACRAAWRLVAIDQDGHDDVRVRSTCDVTDVDEVEGTSHTTRSSETRECLWSATTDGWDCGAIGGWLVDGSAVGGLFGETSEALRASLGGLGARVPELLERARAEEAEEDEEPDDGE